jgi:hypothetical protein
LSGYIQEFVRLASDMSEGRASDTDSAPIDYSNDMLGYIKAPFNDEAPPLGYEFGSVTPTGNAKPVYNHKVPLIISSS